jgi:hypothetical protein
LKKAEKTHDEPILEGKKRQVNTVPGKCEYEISSEKLRI